MVEQQTQIPEDKPIEYITGNTSATLTDRPSQTNSIGQYNVGDTSQDLQGATKEISTNPVNNPVQDIPIHGNYFGSTETQSNYRHITQQYEALVSQKDPDPIKTLARKGVTRNELAYALADNNGLKTIEEGDNAVLKHLDERTKYARLAGNDIATITAGMEQNGYDPSLVEVVRNTPLHPADWDPRTLSTQYSRDRVGDLASLYKEIHGKYSTPAKIIGGIFSNDMAISARQDINKLNYSIADMLLEKGIDAFVDQKTGEAMFRMPNGAVFPVEEGFLDTVGRDLFNSKFEAAGSIAGAIAGGITGRNIGAGIGGTIFGVAPNALGVTAVLPEEAITVPTGVAIGGWAGGAIGTLIGGATGASAGKAMDMTISSIQLREKLSAGLYFNQMKDAAIFDGVLSILGSGAIQTIKTGSKYIMNAYKYVMTGSPKAAERVLKETLHMTDEQVTDMIAQFEKVTGKPADETIVVKKGVEQATTKPLARGETAIKVAAQTQEGLEPYIGYVTSKSPSIANRLIESVDERAKALVNTVNTMTGSDIGTVIRGQLDTYVQGVKDFYDTVKTTGIKAVNGTDFRFDGVKLALEPTLNQLRKGISDPRHLERFAAFEERVLDASQGRSFSDLLELRQTVNAFKYGGIKFKEPALRALNATLNRIDSQIAKAVKTYMPGQGPEWLRQFAKAKGAYSEMKQVEQNTLYKLLTRKGVTGDDISKAMVRYIDSLDSTFTQVMEKLPYETRVKAEAAVAQRYVDRYTLGTVGEKQALHFPMIDKSLSQVNFTTPEVKYFVERVSEMAKVFRNDVNLSKVSGNIALPKFQSYLTTNPVMRAKYELASGIFGFIKHRLPTNEGRQLTTLNTLAKVLDAPLHANTVDKLIAGLPKSAQPEIQNLVKQFQIEMAKKKPTVTPMTKMYKQTTNGQLAISQGRLGKGIYLVEKVVNPRLDSKVIRQDVDMSRMATLQDIATITGKEVTEKDIREIPNLQQQLMEKGFKGVRVEGRAMLFPDAKPVK